MASGEGGGLPHLCLWAWPGSARGACPALFQCPPFPVKEGSVVPMSELVPSRTEAVSQFPAPPACATAPAHSRCGCVCVYQVVLRPGFSLCSASNHPPTSLSVQTAGKPAAKFCARSIVQLSFVTCPAGSSFHPPSPSVAYFLFFVFH